MTWAHGLLNIITEHSRSGCKKMVEIMVGHDHTTEAMENWDTEDNKMVSGGRWKDSRYAHLFKDPQNDDRQDGQWGEYSTCMEYEIVRMTVMIRRSELRWGAIRSMGWQTASLRERGAEHIDCQFLSRPCVADGKVGRLHITRLITQNCISSTLSL